MTVKTTLVRGTLGALLGAATMLAMGSPASAVPDYASTCRNRLEADRGRIDHDVARFGEGSGQVARDRDKMEADRSWCRDHKAEWDHSRFDIGIYLHK